MLGAYTMLYTLPHNRKLHEISFKHIKKFQVISLMTEYKRKVNGSHLLGPVFWSLTSYVKILFIFPPQTSVPIWLTQLGTSPLLAVRSSSTRARAE